MLETIAIFAAGSYLIVEVVPRAAAWVNYKTNYTVQVQTSDEYQQHLKDLDSYREEKVLKN